MEINSTFSDRVGFNLLYFCLLNPCDKFSREYFKQV